MIIDTFDNAKKYYSLNKNFQTAFEYIFKTDFEKLSVGNYNIKDDEIYCSVSEYTTKEVSKPEYHKKYIDIQFLQNGEEYIGYTNINNIKTEKFDIENDIGFGVGKIDYIKMEQGLFMILFPDDAHQPCMAIDTPKNVKKIVVKVKLADE